MDRPSLYILHGDDPFAIQRTVDSMLAKMGDPAMAELNLTRLDGGSVNEEAVRSAAGAMPFLTDRRMVILTHPFASLRSEPARKRFLSMLETLPDSTALVMIIEDAVERGKWKTYKEDHWLRRWAAGQGARVFYQLCQLPPLGQMQEWIRREAKAQGGQFNPDAASALMGHIGNDTRTASLEIDKLLTYVNRQRAVEIEDVEELVAQSGQANVFDMVDALSAGNASLALNLLHRLMEEGDEFSLFGMIVRQFRLLLQAKELLDEGKGVNDVNAEVAHTDFVARKLVGQAQRFSLVQLEAIYHRLLEIDEAVKTSQVEMSVALDTFIAGLAR